MNLSQKLSKLHHDGHIDDKEYVELKEAVGFKECYEAFENRYHNEMSRHTTNMTQIISEYLKGSIKGK